MTYRILHIVPGLGHGGAEHQLLMNVQHLDSQKFENHVCYLFPRTILVPQLEEAGATVHSLETHGPLATPRRLWKLIRLIRRLKPDLIHTSNIPGEMYGGIAGRLTGTPVVGTLTNTSDPDVRMTDNPNVTRFKLGIVDWYRYLILRRTHAKYVAISQHVAESTIHEAGVKGESVAVIYRGIDPTSLDVPESAVEAVRTELGLAAHTPVVLSVGRLVPQKGHRYLIEAMQAVREKHPEAVLLLVGQGFLEQTLKKQVQEMGLEDTVRFLGRRDDVPVLMKAADMFVFPSLYEGLGVAMLEACSHGCAVVATNTGPIPEIVHDGETGLLVEPADPQAIADAVVRLTDDPDLRERLSAAAAANITQNFTIDRSAAMLEDLYEMTIKRPQDPVNTLRTSGQA